jgi:hypothetical protein
VADKDEKPSGLRDFLKKTVGAGWAAFVGLVVIAVATAAYVAIAADPRHPPGSLKEQLGAIRHRQAVAVHPRRPVVDKEIDLRGTGAQAHLLVFRDDRLFSARHKGPFFGNAPASDEIQIWEEGNGELKLRYRFQPDISPQPGSAYVFEVQSASDLDGNGRPEIIGAFSQAYAGRPYQPLPVVLSWDDASDSYGLHSLVERRPSLRDMNRPYRKNDRLAYGLPVKLGDSRADERIRGFQAEGFAVAALPGEVRLAMGYYKTNPSDPVRVRAEIAVWKVDLQRPRPEAVQCDLAPVWPSTRWVPTVVDDIGTDPRTLRRLLLKRQRDFAC